MLKDIIRIVRVILDWFQGRAHVKRAEAEDDEIIAEMDAARDAAVNDDGVSWERDPDNRRRVVDSEDGG